MKNTTETSALSLLANDAGYDPLEDRLRENIRSTIEAVFEEELAQFGRCRWSRGRAIGKGSERAPGAVTGRDRRVCRVHGSLRKTVEWRSRACATSGSDRFGVSVRNQHAARALFGLFRGA